MTNQNYIFISYARANSNTVVPIINDLTNNGFNLWYDKDICVGTEWPDYIEEKIKNCFCVMIFVSKASVDSINVRNEINFALSKNKEIFTFFLEDTELKHGLGLQIGNKQSFLAYKHTSYESMMKELTSAQILQSCKNGATDFTVTSDHSPLSLKNSIKSSLNSFQNAIMKLQGNPSSAILQNIFDEENKLKSLINELQDSSRAQYLMHLSKIDLFLNALKMQFATLTPDMLSYQLMFIDTYISQMLPEIELMRQI